MAFVVAASAGVIKTLGPRAHDPERKAAGRQHDEQSGADRSGVLDYSKVRERRGNGGHVEKLEGNSSCRRFRVNKGHPPKAFAS
jgi:hypothetical protein